MTAPIRYTSQKQQELISRHQLCERVTEFGWLSNSPEDLGEDFIVHIYYQGRATGVLFHIQLKSITNLHERRKGDFLVYDDIKVKDLKRHWEDFTLPVVLVVWDIELREGRWALVDKVIEHLDKERPQWRENKSKVRVYIPWNNTTDDDGLTRLKQSIGRLFYPLIAKEKPLEINLTMSFPDTEEGREAWKAVERSIKEGEPGTFQGKFIQQLTFSEWWMRWFGEFDPQNIRISLGLPAQPRTFPVYLDMISADGVTASTPPIELKEIKVGTELRQLSNEHQDTPLHFRFSIPNLEMSKEGTISIKLNNLGRNVRETRDTVRFLRVITTGGKLQLNFPTHDNASLTITVPPKPEKAPDPWFVQLIDKLCTIQENVGKFIQVPLKGLTHEDVQAINELAAIIKRGRTIAKAKEIIWEFNKFALDIILDVHRQDKPIHLTVTSDKSHVDLLGLEIPTGHLTRHITGTPEMSVAELKKAIAALGSDEYLPLKLIEVEVVEIFPDWYIREAQRLSQCLVDNFGAESVYLFGSLAWSDVHAVETDIDLAVNGLPAERYLEAVGYLERESNFPVDLVELSKVPDHLRQRILTEGKLLNEREPAMALG